MIGIQDIGVYIPSGRLSNYERKVEYGVDDQFIQQKLGIESVAIKESGTKTSDLAAKAVEDLFQKTGLDKGKVDCLVLVTQNPDYNLPHTSAVLHEKIDLPENCAAFDVSLGCSGFVYALSITQAFMEQNDLKTGILVTADPYSTIIDQNDRNTAMLFGDAATATLITERPRLISGKFTFGTIGKSHRDLVSQNQCLHMNGRGIFNFAARTIPQDVEKLLALNSVSLNQIDRFLFHQASRYMIETIAGRLKIPASKAAFEAQDYGNTVSSSIPILLANELDNGSANTIVISGFGVGLSWSSGILFRTQM